MPNINVTVTPDYRLITDARNYIVKERYFSDPTKAIGYKAVPGAEKPPLKETWDHPQHQYHYSLTSDGLARAVSFIVAKSVGQESETLAELLAAYNAESAKLRALVTRAITGQR